MSRQLKARSVFYAVGYGIIALFPTLTGLWIGLICWSAGEALLMPPLNALVAEYTGSESRLGGFSLAVAAIGIGEASGNVAGVALLSGSLSAGKVWPCYAVLAGASLLACAGSRYLGVEENYDC